MIVDLGLSMWENEAESVVCFDDDGHLRLEKIRLLHREMLDHYRLRIDLTISVIQAGG